MNIKILESAFVDLTRAKNFYSAHHLQLGDYFVESVSADIDSLVLYAGIHQKVFGFYRMLVHRFPYAIYYQIVPPASVLIYRVLDCRQNPKKLKLKLFKI